MGGDRPSLCVRCGSLSKRADAISPVQRIGDASRAMRARPSMGRRLRFLLDPRDRLVAEALHDRRVVSAWVGGAGLVEVCEAQAPLLCAARGSRLAAQEVGRSEVGRRGHDGPRGRRPRQSTVFADWSTNLAGEGFRDRPKQRRPIRRTCRELRRVREPSTRHGVTPDDAAQDRVGQLLVGNGWRRAKSPGRTSKDGGRSAPRLRNHRGSGRPHRGRRSNPRPVVG